MMLNVHSSAPTTNKVKKIYNFGEMNDKISENLLDLSVSKSMHNLHLDYGKLTSGIGVKNAEISLENGSLVVPDFPEDIVEQVFVYYRYDRDNKRPDNYLIARAKSGYFYRLSLESSLAKWEKLPTIIHDDDVMAVNYRYNNKDVIFFCSESLVLTMYDGQTIKLIGKAPRITSITEHYGRIFVSTYGEGDVWFSDDYDPLNWNVSLSEAGFIKFSDTLGKTIKVVSFNDYVYIFREHGIYRLVAIGDQKNFELTKVAELNSKIYKNSISICNDKIMFLTSDGLYKFDGFDAVKIKDNIKKLENISEKTIVSSYADNKYVVCFYDEEDSKVNSNNSMFVYDTINNVIELYKDLYIRDLAPINFNDTSNCLVVLSNTNLNKIGMFDYSAKCYNTYLKYQFESVKSYLGNISKDKYIHKIRLITPYNLSIKVITDNHTSVHFVKGKQGVSELLINQKTKSIKLIIWGYNEADLSGIEIEYSEVR